MLPHSSSYLLLPRFPRGLTVFLALLLSLSANALTITLEGGSVKPGSAIQVSGILETEESNLSTLVGIIDIDNDLPVLQKVTIGSAAQEAGKVLSWNLLDNQVILTLYGGFTPIPAGILFSLTIAIPEEIDSETTILLRDAGSSGADPDAQALDVQLSDASIQIIPDSGAHAADSNLDFAIDLSELLRVIQFFNSFALHCEAGSEDGYAPGTGNQTCTPHDSDYNPQDWVVNLSELLRLIQFYNFEDGAYHPDANGEDGFEAGSP